MLANLKDIINPDVIINIASKDKTLILKESGVDSEIKKLHISGIPDNALAFTLDHQPKGNASKFFKQLSCYINAGNSVGVNKSCDLVIVTQEGESVYNVLVFDLKSSKPNQTATIKQLNNSELYVKYLVSMLKYHYNIQIKEINYRHAIVTTDPRSMRKTSVYSPNTLPTRNNSYNIKPVSENGAKEARVHFAAL